MTHFEYLTVTYGLWVAIIFSGLIGIALKINLDDARLPAALLRRVGNIHGAILYVLAGFSLSSAILRNVDGVTGPGPLSKQAVASYGAV